MKMIKGLLFLPQWLWSVKKRENKITIMTIIMTIRRIETLCVLKIKFLWMMITMIIMITIDHITSLTYIFAFIFFFLIDFILPISPYFNMNWYVMIRYGVVWCDFDVMLCHIMSCFVVSLVVKRILKQKLSKWNEIKHSKLKFSL